MRKEPRPRLGLSFVVVDHRTTKQIETITKPTYLLRGISTEISKTTHTHDNNLYFLSLKLKLNNILIIVDPYAMLEDRNCKGLSCIKDTSISLDRDLALLTFDLLI